MNRSIISTMLAIALLGCGGTTETNHGSTGAGGAGGSHEGGGGVADGQTTSTTTTPTCVGGNGPNRTCKTDCDCQPGLECRHCVNTVDYNCLHWCPFGDPLCSNGVATCPKDVGLECPSVMLCQPVD